MCQLLDQLLSALRRGQRVAYTSLVETRGSTPQKAGAAMLVFADGSQAGTLGGGCVEAEVKRRALQLMDSGQAEILTFQLDSNYGWDDGLICGGRMKMLVDPVSPEDDAYFRTWADLISADEACTEAVVIDAEKSGGGHPAERFLINDQGECVAARGLVTAPHPREIRTLPGDRLPAALRAHLRPVGERPRPYVEAGVSYLPVLKRCRLVVVGAGHVGQKVAELASDVDFDVWVVDDRQEYCNSDRFPRAERLFVGEIEAVLSALEVTRDTYCLIITRGHNHDEEALYHLVNRPAAYIGLIGSRRKIRMIFDDLLGEGISSEALRKVYAPIGIEIGSQTVPEIAVSIVAELIAHRNLGDISALRPARNHLVEESARQPICNEG